MSERGMRRLIALTACVVAWPLAALVEGLCTPCAALYVWANTTRADAERGIRELRRA